MPSPKIPAIRCVGTGFIVFDIIRRAVDAHTVIERRHAGGTCGNVLAILAWLGHHADAVGRIGDDAFGHELIDDLQRCGVGVRCLDVEAGRATPVVYQESMTDARGRAKHRFFRRCPHCGAALPGYRPLLMQAVEAVASSLPEHEVFFFDRVAPGPLELARRSRARGAVVVFEPSGVKNEEAFLEALQVAHVVKYSHERLRGIDALTARAKVPVEVETCGADGLRVRQRQRGRLGAWWALEAVAAREVRDTSGSGDWCTAGFVHHLATRGRFGTDLGEHSELIADALRVGQRLAALNCAYDGARGLMYARTREEVVAAMRGEATTASEGTAQGVTSRRAKVRGLCASGLHAAQG